MAEGEEERVKSIHPSFSPPRCNTLQHTATHCSAHTCRPRKTNHRIFFAILVQHSICVDCNTLQHTATHTHADHVRSIDTFFLPPYCNTLQDTATHCNTLQHTATHCNTLQHAQCNTLQHTATQYNAHTCRSREINRRILFATLLQHSATHCNVLNATHCNTLQHTATHCNAIQRAYMQIT